ncbi:hypothetical protein [Spirosoma pulveris]
MKKFIVAGCVAATLLGGYACTKSTDLAPDEANAAAARTGAVQSGTATGPHSGTGRPGKPFSGTATGPHSGTDTHPHSGTDTPPHSGTGGAGTPHGPHSGTATQPASGTGGPGGHPRGHGPNH